jgi:hypothetical protein
VEVLEHKAIKVVEVLEHKAIKVLEHKVLKGSRVLVAAVAEGPPRLTYTYRLYLDYRPLGLAIRLLD